MSLYKNKYRIESTRLDVWDYSKYGYYFVTICTREKKCVFGNVIDDKIILNKIGNCAQEIWSQIPSQFEDVYLDEFVIMPNHIHGIIFISKDSTSGRDLINQVSTNKKIIKNNPMLMDLSLGKILRWFKAKTAHEIHYQLEQKDFAWQTRYYEHIIRNEKSLQKIRDYISLNPLKWTIDDENPDRITTKTFTHR